MQNPAGESVLIEEIENKHQRFHQITGDPTMIIGEDRETTENQSAILAPFCRGAGSMLDFLTNNNAVVGGFRIRTYIPERSTGYKTIAVCVVA